MPSLEVDGWELESAKDRQALAPASFHLPSRDERIALRPGQRVQLLFLMQVDEAEPPDVMCEKMWVTIDRITPDGYVGTLDSMPASSDALAPGDVIDFGPQHISCVLIPKTDPRHPEYKPGIS